MRGKHEENATKSAGACFLERMSCCVVWGKKPDNLDFDFRFVVGLFCRIDQKEIHNQIEIQIVSRYQIVLPMLYRLLK